MKPILRFFVLVGVCFFFCAATNDSTAQEIEKPAQEKNEMLVARILVLDPDGHPLDGATVLQRGLNSNSESNTTFTWRVDEFGPEPTVVTNAEGIAEFPYPRFLAEGAECDVLHFSIEHPEFVFIWLKRADIHNNPVEFKLERGFRVAASAVHGETGEAIKTDLFALLSTRPFEPWKLHENGMLVSPVFKESESLLRVMRIVEGEPVLFSDPITIKPDGNSRVMLKDVKLFPGTRVEGRLADEVPRPVKNGYVCAGIIHLPENNNPLETWSWHEKTPIAEDGTFVFESLPSNAVLQLVPICDDWVPAKPTEASVLQFFPGEIRQRKGSDSLPQLLELTGGTATVLLDMVAATSARIKVVDPDGNPLTNAEVFLQPHQYWFLYGSSSWPLGYARDHREVLLSGKPTLEASEAAQARFRTVTDGDGVAIVGNLPVNARVHFDVTYEGYELPASDSFLTYTVQLKAGEVGHKMVRMQKKTNNETAKDEKGKEAGGVNDGR